MSRHREPRERSKSLTEMFLGGEEEIPVSPDAEAAPEAVAETAEVTEGLKAGTEKPRTKQEVVQELEAGQELAEAEVGKSLMSGLWEKVPGFDIKSARENFKAREFFKTVSNKKIIRDITVGDVLVSFSAGGAGAGAARATRYGLGVMTGGAGYPIAMAGGAVSGAVAQGIRTYVSERKREISPDELIEKVRALEKKDLRIHPNLNAKLNRYLELTDKEEISEELSGELTKEKNDLYRELKREFGVRWEQIGRGVLRGALIGAVGGVVGNALINYFGLVRETAEHASAALKGASGAAKDEAVGEALRQKMQMAATEAHAKTFEKAIAAGVEGLKEKDFTEVAQKGEGLTHIARKLIADYLTQREALGLADPKMEPGQLVYAEDLLRKTVLGGDSVVKIGDNFKLKGDRIWDVLLKAKELNQEQIENLRNKWVKGIGQKAWEHSSVFNPDNDFAKEILEQAKEQAAEAAKTEAAKLGEQAAGEAIRQAGGEIGAKTSQAAQSWFSGKVIAWGLLGGAGAAGLGLALKKIAQGRGTRGERAEAKIKEKLAEKLRAFAGRPEVINLGVIQKFQEDFNKRFPYGVYGLVMGEPARGITAPQAYDGMKKLMNVLGSFEPPLHFKNTIIRVGLGLISYNRNPDKQSFEFGAEIQVDPSLPEDRMREYLARAAKEIGQRESKP